MHPFWDVAIAPLIDAVAPARVVEIGVRHGQTTRRILEHLAAGAEVHIIDPEPAFDPDDVAVRGGARCIFHRTTSHDTLAPLPAVDVALVDGDHNWYTVYHELRLLRAAARDAGAALPLLVLHDVGWPYGRRDLYYAPERIPDEFRQPFARRGMRPGRRELVAGSGGVSPGFAHALHEGGPRNGVMTALDDFLAEHDAPCRVVVIPVYFGLAIVAERRRLGDAVVAVLDELESANGRQRLLELAEAIRLEGLLNQSNRAAALERQVEELRARDVTGGSRSDGR
jgi:hypothetical protein